MSTYRNPATTSQALHHALCAGKLLLLSLFFITSCTSEDGDPALNGQEENEVVLSLYLPGTTSDTRTALTEAQENQVTAVDVLVFGSDGKYQYTSTGYAINKDTNSPPANISAVYDFTVRLLEGTNLDLWVIANGRTQLGSYTTSQTKEDIAKLLLATEAHNVTHTTTGTATPIPMWGILKGRNVTTGGLSGSSTVNLFRMIAKIDVEVATAAQSNFKLTSVHFYNRNSNGRIVPVEGNGSWTAAAASASASTPSLPPSPTKVTATAQPYTTMTTLDKAIKGEIYAFEATKGNGYSNASYKTDPCLVIGGKYGGSATQTYYRIDFVNASGTYLHLLRNYRYAVSIEKVSGPGLSSPDIARDARPVNLEADVIAWNESGMNEVVMDGQNVLSVSRDEITFYQQGVDEELTILTDWEDGWTIDTQTLPDWITTTPAPSGNKLIGAKNTPVTIKLKMNKTATATATFYVTAGRLKKQITLIPRLNQLKYVSTTSLTIPQGGGNPVTDLTMKFTGEYAGSFNVNAYVGATPVGTYSDSNKDTHPVRVDPNETWSARTVKFTYSGVNLPEQAIPDTRSQSGYNITGTGINNTSIPWNGHNYSITITGDYPTGVLIYAVKKGTNTLVSNEVGAIPTTVLAIEPNLDNATRALEIRAKHTDMLTPGYLKLKETNLTQNHRPITFTYNSATYAVVEMYNQSSQNILATNRVPTFTLSSYVPEGYTLVTENSTIRSALITFVTTNNGYALNNNTQSVKTVNYTVFGILFVDNNTAISTTPKSSGAREIETNSGIHFGNDGNFSQFWSDGGNTGMWLINGASTNYTHIKFYIVVRKNS